MQFHNGSDDSTRFIDLTLVRVEGATGSPAWIWNHLASIAAVDGAEYFYQVLIDVGVKCSMNVVMLSCLLVR